MSEDIYTQYNNELTVIFGANITEKLKEGEQEPETSFIECVGRMRDTSKNLGLIEYTPSVFGEDDIDTCISIPSKSTREWKSLERAIDSYIPEMGVMYMLPSFWQIESMFHRIVRKQGLPMYQGVRGNLPVATEVAQKTSLDFIVTDSSTKILLDEALDKKGILKNIKGALNVIAMEDVAQYLQMAVLDSGYSVAHEVHAAPGYVLLQEDIKASKSGRVVFEMNNDYVWELSDEATYITAIAAEALPVCRFKLPFVIKQISDSTCKILV